MIKRIPIALVFIFSVAFSFYIWPEVVLWMDPWHRRLNPTHPSGSILAVMWYWSFALLPLFVGMCIFRIGSAFYGALALLGYSPLFLAFDALFARSKVFCVTPRVFLLFLLPALISGIVVVLDARSWRTSDRHTKVGPRWKRFIMWSLIHAVCTYTIFFCLFAWDYDSLMFLMLERLSIVLAMPVLFPIFYSAGYISSDVVVFFFVNSMVWGTIITFLIPAVFKIRSRNTEQSPPLVL
jgi:hypothetical protein